MTDQRTLRLNPSAISAPLYATAADVADVVSAALRNLAIEPATDPALVGHAAHLFFRGSKRTPEARKQFAETWLLNNGFQDLARGLRASLEAAAVLIALTQEVQRLPRPFGLDQVKAIEKRAAARAHKLHFGTLVDEINATLPLAFGHTNEALSIQKVRNCLEHRRGIVGSQDIDPLTQRLRLAYPLTRAFAILEDGTEVPMRLGLNEFPVSRATNMTMRQVIVTKDFELGERIMSRAVV